MRSRSSWWRCSPTFDATPGAIATAPRSSKMWCRKHSSSCTGAWARSAVQPHSLASLEESRELARVPPDELRIDLVNAIEALSPSHREVLLLRDLEDLTLGEIAELHGVSDQAG